MLEAGPCYYLGHFPNYWDFKYRVVAYPHSLPVELFAQMAVAPRMYDMEAVAKSSELFQSSGIYGVPIEDYVSDTIKNQITEAVKTYGEQAINYYLYPETIPPEYTPAQKEQITKTSEQIGKDLDDLMLFYKPENARPYLSQYFEIQRRLDKYYTCVRKEYPKQSYLPRSTVQTPTGPQSYSQPKPVTLPYPDTVERPGIAPPWAIGNLILNFGEKPGTLEPTLTVEINIFFT